MQVFDEEGRLKVNFGATAANINIVDGGGYFAATEVESALQELGHLTALTVAEVDQLENIGATTISAAQWGYLGALTTDPIGGDGTAGRILRMSFLKIKDGTAANTLKCEVASIWNGDTIAETDDVAKGALTGHFTLDANGEVLTIEVAGLLGNVLGAIGILRVNSTGTDILAVADVIANDIRIRALDRTTNTLQDLTAIINGAELLYINVIYITDA